MARFYLVKQASLSRRSSACNLLCHLGGKRREYCSLISSDDTTFGVEQVIRQTPSLWNLHRAICWSEVLEGEACFDFSCLSDEKCDMAGEGSLAALSKTRPRRSFKNPSLSMQPAVAFYVHDVMALYLNGTASYIAESLRRSELWLAIELSQGKILEQPTFWPSSIEIQCTTSILSAG